jgi:uroporphyrinogen decarboxylase
MLPKERMIAALEHREADRVPVGEIHTDWDIVERALGRQTYVHSQWREWTAEWDGRRDEVAASYGHDLVDLARTFEWDFVPVPLVPARRARYSWPEMVGEYTWRDAAGIVWQYSPETGGLPISISAPALGIDQLTTPAEFQVDESRLEAIRHVVKELGGSHFVVGVMPDPTFPWRYFDGFEGLLMRMATEPEYVRKAVDVCLPGAIAWAEAMCDAGCDAILNGVDYCDNQGPFMGPRLFREHCQPALAAIVRAVRRKGKFFIKHCDGYTWPILDDFVAAGADAWHGIQPPIGMDFARLKEKYAGKLCLCGGVNVDTLVRGTPAQVVAEVREALTVAAPGGGYVVSSGNSLLVGTKYENYQALLTAAREFGQYPMGAT